MTTLKPYSNGLLYRNAVIGTMAVDGCIWWAVTFGTVRRGLAGLHNSIPYPNPYHVLLHAYDRMKIEDSYGQHI